jgi:uncharacterized protein YegL
MSPRFELHCLQSASDVAACAEPQTLYVLAEVTMADQPAHFPEAPVHLILVIDRSTSMRGARISEVRAAIRHLTQQLRSTDRIAVIGFNDRAETVLALQAPGDGQALARGLERLEPSGGTEMAAGLALVAAEFRRSVAGNAVRRVFLLSDGRTYGDEAQCVALARRLQGRGIGITAIGLGDEWNEELLQTIGAGPNSKTVYLPTPDELTPLLDAELARARTALAPELTLHLSSGAGVELRSVARVEPFIAPLSTLPLDNGASSVPLDGWTATERHLLLLEFTLPPLTSGRCPFARLALSHSQANLLLDPPAPPIVQTLNVRPSDFQPPPAPALVVRCLERLTAYRLQEAAWRELAAGNTERAYDRLMMARTRLLATRQIELARIVDEEAARLLQTHGLSAGGRKQIAFGTRGLTVRHAHPPAGEDPPAHTTVEPPWFADSLY